MTMEPTMPPLYVRMIECGVVNLEPWELLSESERVQRTRHLAEVFLFWSAVPFARRIDNDEVACWTGASVVVVDDFDMVKGPDGEALPSAISEYASMDEWLLVTVQDFIEFN